MEELGQKQQSIIPNRGASKAEVPERHPGQKRHSMVGNFSAIVKLEVLQMAEFTECKPMQQSIIRDTGSREAEMLEGELGQMLETIIGNSVAIAELEALQSGEIGQMLQP